MIFYEVLINNEKYFINGKKYKDLILFKTEEQFVLDAYPNLTEKTPLRATPNDSAEIIKGYAELSYVSVEIKGDWLKIKDDKDCYSGPFPSKTDIIGWVKWRENGRIILDIRHRC